MDTIAQPPFYPSFFLQNESTMIQQLTNSTRTYAPFAITWIVVYLMDSTSILKEPSSFLKKVASSLFESSYFRVVAWFQSWI